MNSAALIRRTNPIRIVATALCMLVIYAGIEITNQQYEIFAQDRSTSITCSGSGPCEKTECINGDCQTVSTNSSTISSTTGSIHNPDVAAADNSSEEAGGDNSSEEQGEAAAADDGSEADKRSSMAELLRERLVG